MSCIIKFMNVALLIVSKFFYSFMYNNNEKEAGCWNIAILAHEWNSYAYLMSRYRLWR